MMSWPRGGHVAESILVEIKLPWRTIVVGNGKGVFVPSGDWGLLGEYVGVRGWGELAAPTGAIIIRPAVQVAADPKSPWLVTPTSTTFEGEGVYEPGEPVRIDIPTSDEKKKDEEAGFIRVGWFAASPNDELVAAAVSGAIELLNDC